MRYAIPLFLILGVLFWTTHYYGQRPQTFSEIMRDMTRYVQNTQATITKALLPAIREAAAAFTEFESTMKTINQTISEHNVVKAPPYWEWLTEESARLEEPHTPPKPS